MASALTHLCMHDFFIRVFFSIISNSWLFFAHSHRKGRGALTLLLESQVRDKLARFAHTFFVELSALLRVEFSALLRCKAFDKVDSGCCWHQKKDWLPAFAVPSSARSHTHTFDFVHLIHLDPLFSVERLRIAW